MDVSLAGQGPGRRGGWGLRKSRGGPTCPRGQLVCATQMPAPRGQPVRVTQMQAPCGQTAMSPAVPDSWLPKKCDSLKRYIILLEPQNQALRSGVQSTGLQGPAYSIRLLPSGLNGRLLAGRGSGAEQCPGCPLFFGDNFIPGVLGQTLSGERINMKMKKYNTGRCADDALRYALENTTAVFLGPRGNIRRLAPFFQE